jgi:hypothetical protein
LWQNAARMKKSIACVLLIFLAALPAVATPPEDAAADAVAAAFAQARQDAHLPKLERMGRNKFREKICKQDMRFGGGLIKSVLYETDDPAHLPDSAKKLAAETYAETIPARFGIGVCATTGSPGGPAKFSVVIATYLSRSASFWRTFD